MNDSPNRVGMNPATEGWKMELNINIKGQTQGDILASLMAYLLETKNVENKGLEIAQANVPGVDAQWGGDGP